MHKFFYEQRKAFSIRKLTVGVVSLCIGSSLLVGQNALAADTLVTSSTKDIHFEYVLETELTKDERQLIQSSLPAELTETATYFVVYRPAKTALPKTGDGVASGLLVAAGGFIVLAVLATKKKKARVLSMLYITATGLALPLLEVSAVESQALASYNQTITIRPGDSLPDGKLRLDGYEFVGYLVEEKPEVQSQARDEKTSLSNSSQIEVPKTGQETAEADQQVSTGQIGEKTDELVQPDHIQTGQNQASQPVIEQIDETEESQKPVDLPTESPVDEDKLRPVVEETKPSKETVPPPVVAVEEKLVTSIPAHAPSHLLPTIDFQVQDKVEETALEIPEEQIETNQLPLGQSRVEEGQAGSLRISYQEVLVDGQVVARKEISREEVPSIARKVYIGTGQVAEEEVGESKPSEDPVQQTPVEEKPVTSIPTEAPSHLLPTIDFLVQDKVEETTLAIPEEVIETDELAIGQSRVEEGQSGSLRISYQEVLVDGQVVARKEISREEVPSIPRKVYIGTGQVAEEEVVESKPSEEPVQPTPVEEKLVTSIPTETPSHHLPTLAFQVEDKIEETTLAIPEEVIETDELAIGQSRVEEGQAGSLHISYQEVLVDGRIVARTEISREEIPSRPKRTYIGTRRDEKYVAPEKLELPRAIIRTQEEEITFERKEVLRADWPLGKIEVVAGKNGKRLHTYAVIEGVETLLKTEVLEQARAEVTYKGVKRPEMTTEEVVIAFTERVISDPEQYTDYRQIDVTGEQGLKRLHKENGQLVNEEIVKPAKEQVVRVGTKPIEGQVEKESLRTIDFTRRYESNDQLDYGQTRTKQPGQSGQEKVISTYQTIKGVEGQFISSRIVSVRPVQDEIIEVGTKPQVRIEQEEPVTEYVAAPDRERDVQTLLQEGHGKETTYQTIYNLDTASGRVTPIHLPGKVTHLGQVRRISVGTKPTVTKKTLPFSEEVVSNSTLYVGERVIVRPGRAGEEITTVHYTLNTRTGETSAGLPQIQEIQPVAQVVQVGTKAVDRTVETVDNRNIAFQTEFQADPTLPYPQREVLQEGSNGVERITTTRRYVRDQEVGEPTQEIKVVRAAQNRIIKVGTKPVVRRVETDFTRVYEADPNRSLNEQFTKQSGIKQETTYTKNYVLNTETGEVREQAETRQVTRFARQEIVQVGTRPTTETTSRILPTRYEADINRAHGQQHARQQGRPEITTFTTTYSVDPRTGATQGVRDTGRVTDRGQEQIVQVGTRPTTETTSRVLPTRYEADNSRVHGQQHTRQQGRPEITTYTTTYSVDPRTGATQGVRDTGRVTDIGQEQIVQVGTRPTTETTSRVLLTRYEADNSRVHGQQYTRQQGRPEITTYTTTYSVDPRTGATQGVRDTGRVTDRGQEQIIRVGTKPVVRRVETDFTRVYEADPNRSLNEQHIKQSGIKQETTYTKNYVLNTETGEVREQAETSQVTRTGRQEIVQVGTRPTTETTSRVLPTRYEADNNRVHGQQHTRQQGRPEITTFTTTYSVDPRTGTTQGVRDTGRVTDRGQEQIVRVGTKPVVRRVETDFTRVYEADSNRSLNEQHIKQSGIKQETTYTKNYVLNTETGEVREQAENSQVTRTGRQEIVQVGTRPTTETTSRVLPTRYEADNSRAHGQQHTRQQGRPEITSFTTTYSVDPRTGATQGVRDTGRVTDRGQEQIVQVGTKPVERTEQVILQEIRRPNANIAKGTENVIHEGSPTIRVYRTSYTVNPDTGQLTALQEVLVSVTEGRAREVEIGAKEPDQPVVPPVENEESCPILPDNTEGGTCEAPTEPTEKPSTPDLECILNPTDQCWPEEPEEVNQETVAQLRAKMEQLMSYRSRFRNSSWHTYIDAVYNESEKIIQSGVAADIRTQLDAIDADLEFVIDAQIPKISTDANSGASRAENIELITDANGGTAPRYEDNPTPVTPNPDQGSGTEKPVETPIPPVPPVDQEQPDSPVTPKPEQEKPTVPDTPPVTSEPGTSGSTDSGTTIVPEQPNISETEPVSPEKSEETSEEVVEDVNKPLLRVLKNEPHYHLINKVRSSKVTYKLDDQYNTFRKAIARLFVNDTEIHQEELTDKNKLEVRFRNLLPNVDYFVKTDLVYTDSKNVERTERLMDEVHIDFEERHFEIKNIDEVEVWKNENGRLVRKVAIKVEPNDDHNYFIKLQSDEHKDIFLPVVSIDEESLSGARHFKLQAKFTNPEERHQKLSTYHDTVTVYLPRESREKYSTFSNLLNAMKTQPFGTFELQQDLTASEVVLSETDKAYLSSNFYGTLRGNGFTIYDLKVPLFNDLRGTVSDLNLKAVDIYLPKEAEVGALAKQSDTARVSNVHAQGRIDAKDKIGGIIGESFKTNMTNVSFSGELASITNESNNLVGGLAGWLGFGSIDKGYVDATISSTSSNVKLGGLVGQLENDNTRITSSFATGTIISTKNKDTEVGGLVGAVLQGNNIRIADSIAAVKAVNGHKVYGESQQGDTLFSNIKIVEALSTGEDNPNIGFATSEDVKAIVEDRGRIKTHPTMQVSKAQNVFDITYANEKYTITDRKQAYENMEKLLPFFTRDVIIQHANRLESSDSLVTKKLVDAVPLIGDTPVFDILQNRDQINRLLLHFEDGTVEKHYLVKKQELGSGAVVEYHLLDKNISYTPENYIRNTDIGSMIVELQTQLVAVRFDSNEVNKVLGLPAYQPEKERQLLFLEESFERVKSNISTHLTDLISNYNLVGLDNSAIRDYLKSYISKNKVQLLLGLAYMDKWYNIQFDKVNAKDLMIKKADFFGKNVNSLDQLIRIGSMGAEMLKPKNNYALASQVIAKESIGGDLFDYLEGYRKAFAPDKTTNDWFKTTTKATIIETPSTIKEVLAKQTNPTKDIYKNGFYDKMASNHWMYKEMALILLAMPSKDIFILTDMANTLIGTYAKLSGSDTDKENRLKQIAEEWAGHADYLYNILPEAHKEKMFRRVVTWDNKKINGSWKNSTTPSYYDLKVPAMKHFYIPLGHKHDYTATGAHADYTIDNIYYFEHEATSDDGARVYTHEMTHVADDDTILLGHGKRTSLDYEVYARGLFESITWDNQDRFGINNVYDFSKYDQHNYGRRLTNKTPERFKSTQDLQDYMKGYLDVIYTLDILEAEAVLSLSNPQAKQNWFAQMTTGTRNTSTVNLVNKVPVSLEQLILNGMISRRPYGYGYNSDANAYLEVRAFDPIYGSLNNDGTSRNEYEVRKIAFELLAEYGYENGMVPYLSNQYQAELGKTEENRRIRDDELISKITGSTYSNSATFRKAMFEKRKQNLEKLKSVTLVGTGIQSGEGYFYGGTRTVSASELRQLMQEAVEHDANNNKYYSSNGHDVREQSRVYSLKAAILNGYLRETKDFRESIYLTNP
ncbi:TPA: ZmpA/ZmpB/ZmpC family metallo-endopeptidase [Streptococcus suis]